MTDRLDRLKAPESPPKADKVAPIRPHAHMSGLQAYNDYLLARRLITDAPHHAIHYVDRAALSTALGYPARSDAVGIPYHALDGAPMIDRVPGAPPAPFCRYRLLHPPRNGGKYRQQAGTPPHAYFPLGPAWTDIAHDPTQPVVFTEGELKALRATLTPGFPPTIGLGGVDSFASRNQGTPILPELTEWQWNARTVYVVFDADLGHKGYKPQVQAAIDRFSSTFAALGAAVQILNLAAAFPPDPAAPQDAKLALDDYILQGGTWPILQLTAEKAEAVDDMRALLARYGIHRPSGDVIELTTGHTWKPATFALTVESHRKVAGDKGLIPAARVFLASPRRTLIEGVGVWPARPAGMHPVPVSELTGRLAHRDIEDEPQALAINLFRPPPGWEPPPDDREWRAEQRRVVSTWNKFVDEFFSDEAELHLADLFHRWVATAARDPNSRNFTSWVIQSPQTGIGKSLLAETIARMIGSQLGYIGGPEAFGGAFNYHLLGKLFVVMNEVGDERNFHRHFRQWRTADYLTYEEKFRPRIVNRNIANYLITTNEAVAFRTSREERRDIVYTPPQQSQDLPWRKFMRSQVVPVSTNPATLRMLLAHYRYDAPLGDYSPDDPAPRTRALGYMADHSMSNAEASAKGLLTHMAEVCRKRKLPYWAVEAGALKKAFTGAELDAATVRRHLKRWAPQGRWADVVVRNRPDPASRVLAIGVDEARLKEAGRLEREKILKASHEALLEWLQAGGD